MPVRNSPPSHPTSRPTVGPRAPCQSQLARPTHEVPRCAPRQTSDHEVNWAQSEHARLPTADHDGAAPFLRGDIGDGLRKRPGVTAEVLGRVLPFTVRIVGGSLQDFRAALLGTLVVAVHANQTVHDRGALRHFAEKAGAASLLSARAG